MRKIDLVAAAVLVWAMTAPALAQQPPATAEAPSVPAWVQRGAKGAAQAAMALLAGSWNVEIGIYGTIGRTADRRPGLAGDT